MSPEQILHLAAQLMRQHGLDGWTVSLDRARRRAGGCRQASKQITLSAVLLPTYPEDTVRDVILHEIAHARVGATHGHDAVWQREAARIGATPRALLPGDLPAPPATWVGTCPKCARTRNLYRAPRRVVSCGACSRTFSHDLILRWTHQGTPATPPGKYRTQLRSINTLKTR